MNTYFPVQEVYGRHFFRDWFLYRVEEPRLLEWLTAESGEYASIWEWTHWCVVTMFEVIDILDFKQAPPPRIEISADGWKQGVSDLADGAGI